MKTQISAEMIIVLAAIIAVALLLVSYLQKSSKKALVVLNSKTDKVLEKIKKIK